MKSSDNTLLLAGLFVLIVVIIALIVYYTRPGETKIPDQTSDDTVLKVENLTFERTLNPDPSVGGGGGVSGYTIEPYGVEYATGATQYKELSENVTFTMKWINAPGFNAASVQGFKIEHFVRKEGISVKPTKVEQIIIKTPVTEANTDKDNISIADFGICRAKIVSVGTGANAYAVIGQNSFKLYAVVQEVNKTFSWDTPSTQKFVELYDGRNESDTDAAALKITKDQLSVTLEMTEPETTEFVPKAPEDTSSRTVINKSTYTVSNGNNSSYLAGVYLTTVPKTDGKHFYFTFENGDFLMIAKTYNTFTKKPASSETETDEKFIFEIVDRENNKGKIRQAASRFLNTTARTVEEGPVKIPETTPEKDRKYLSTGNTTEGNSGTLRLYTQKDSNLTEAIFVRFTWTFSERIGAALTTPTGTLSNSDSKTGEVVCISGDYALVGQPGFYGNKGRVIAYTRNASGDWKMVTPLVAMGANENGKFGSSISIDGDYAIIGEPGAGYAYLAKKVKGVWEFSMNATTNPMLKITPTDGGGNFGKSVSISGDYMVIGQPGKKKVYLYSRKNISNVTIIPQTDAGDFGGSVSMSGDRFIVGAKNDGTNNNNAGSVFIYKFNKEDLSINPNVNSADTKKIVGIPWKKPLSPAGEVESNLYFGTSVAIQGKYAFVGAPGFNKNNGRVYVYKLDSNGGWTRANTAARKYYDEKMKNNYTGSPGSRYIGYGNASTADDTIEHPQTSIFEKSTPEIIADMFFGTTLDISGNKLVIGSGIENKVRIYTKNEATVYGGEETGSWNTRKIGGSGIDKDGNLVFQGLDKVPIKLIEPPTKQAGSKFGASVSIDGDNVIIGEPNKKIGTVKGAGASYITTV